MKDSKYTTVISRFLLSDKIFDATLCCKMVYSYLAYTAIREVNECNLEEGWSETFINENENCHQAIPYTINIHRIKAHVCFSKACIYEALNTLREKKLFYTDVEMGCRYIYIPKGMLSKGFLSLRTDTNLKGVLLVLYSFLYSLSVYLEKKNNCVGLIYMSSQKIGERLGLESKTVNVYLCRLKQKGYIERIFKNEIDKYGCIRVIKDTEG